MDECHSPPTKLYYFGPSDGGRVRAPNAHKLGDLEDDILNLDLAKEQLKKRRNGVYISLFVSVAAAKRFLSANNIDVNNAGNSSMYEINTSQLKGVKLYKVNEIAARMGAAAVRPMPDYFGRGTILQEAVRQVAP